MRDYILCKRCECKIVYDGDDTGRERIETLWGNPAAGVWTPLLMCPACIASQEGEATRLRAELAAIRELMNCYNLGGWTDSLALIKERDEAIAELAECKSLLTHAGLIAAQEQHTALRTELAACMVLLDQAYKALKYHREQTRPIHETDEAIAAIDKARKGEGE